jgi:hypothetical protein
VAIAAFTIQSTWYSSEATRTVKIGQYPHLGDILQGVVEGPVVGVGHPL